MSDATSEDPAADALSELTRFWRRYEGDPESALRAITETAVRALRVERASVWLLDGDRTRLRCVDLYEATPGRHGGGLELDARDCPAYFAAIEREEPIAADDAHVDPRTAAFAPRYLEPLGIGALLDAPIRLGLSLVGVVRHEHVGGARAWSRSDQKDGAFLASLASLALELDQRAQREALLTATLESTGEGILALDGARVVAFNRRFLEMWDLTAADLGGLAQLRALMAARSTRMADMLADANEILVGEGGETIDVVELHDGRIYERHSRPQRLRDQIVGRVWSYRDITAQRRAEGRLRASEAKMRDLAIHDGLTGLHNRRHILERLGEAVELGLAAGERVAIAIVDLDCFKRINDDHGHLVGDAVLRDFATTLRDRLRDTDMVGRYGGEEFVLGLRGAGATAVRSVLEQVRAAMAARPPRDGVPAYTFSAGVAELGADGGDVTTLLGVADERMYQAKRAGRDRTV